MIWCIFLFEINDHVSNGGFDALFCNKNWTQGTKYGTGDLFGIGLIPENQKSGQLEIELGTELVIGGSSTPKNVIE